MVGISSLNSLDIIYYVRAFYNKKTTHHLVTKKQSEGQSRENAIDPRTFSELLAYIFETKTSTESPVVFKFADLAGLLRAV